MSKYKYDLPDLTDPNQPMPFSPIFSKSLGHQDRCLALLCLTQNLPTINKHSRSADFGGDISLISKSW